MGVLGIAIGIAIGTAGGDSEVVDAGDEEDGIKKTLATELGQSYARA